MKKSMAEPKIITSSPTLRAKIDLPASKSISNRALVINALAGSKELPEHVSDCDDTRVMVQWLTAQPTPDTIYIGAAGTAMRFSTAMLTVTPGTHIITGSERMQNRPIGVLVDALRQLGADVAYINKEGFPPLKITGRPTAMDGAGEMPTVALSGSVSSQYISALLMIGPTLGGLTLSLTGNIVSRPYIDMTLQIMRDFGAQCRWVDHSTIRVEPTTYTPRRYYVESDWSAASYWYEMVALSQDPDAEVHLPGLFCESLQGDAGGALVFEHLGVMTEFEDEGGEAVVVLRKGGTVTNRLEFDFVRMPDLAQTFVVTCCMMGVPFHFTGLQSLKIKETDRIEALKNELRKLGYVITDRNDSELLWDGERCEPDADPAIDTYEDHRMAMAFAPAAQRLGCIVINNPQVVSKSYPRFWEDMESSL